MAKKKAKKNSNKINNKSNNKIGLLIGAIFIVLSFVLLYFIYKINVLPDKYLYTAIGLVAILDFVILLILKVTKNIFFKIICLLGCVGMGYGIYSLNNTQDVLDTMNVDYKTSNYVIVVNKDSSYKKVNDLKGKKIGYLKDDVDSLDKFKIDFTKKEYTDLGIAINDLLDKKIDGVLLEQSFIDILSDDESPIKDFKEKVRMIDAFSVDEKVEDVTTDTDTTKNGFAVYVSGIDTYGSIASVSRTDANMVVFVNPNSKQILMLSIPRDYYVTLHGKGKDKLTHVEYMELTIVFKLLKIY